MRQTVALSDAHTLPLWRRPIALLCLMAFSMPLAFSTWAALLNNFAIEVIRFDGSDIGWLHSVREIPGFLAVGVIYVLTFLREQTLANLSLLLMGLAIAVTAWFPTFGGLLITTMIGSVGFHYYETVKMSLELQWVDKARAPRVLGWLVAIGSAASLVAYGGIVLLWKALALDFSTVYLVSGGVTAIITLFCWFAYPTFKVPVAQHQRMVLRSRYWLYYALQAAAGARRQIFMVFAAFMMVERFGFEVHEVTALFLINYVANMVIAPLLGRFVTLAGERNALAFEYVGLIIVFSLYGGIYMFGWGVVLAATLYVIDHLFFALAFAQKTYFQKIAHPADIAPTAAVAFTINHIGAVLLPFMLGYLWLISPAAVFGFAAGITGISLALALMIPRHPAPGCETIFTDRAHGPLPDK
ncbi:MAG: MFS transporter [Rhodobacteraceae bacterium]|nr:MFS transporter [Paracoccaceae bacterium]